MGLVYTRSNSQNLIQGLTYNINVTSQMLENLTSNSHKIINAVESKALSGAAYTAGKGIFAEVIIPTIQRAETIIDNVKQDLASYQHAEQAILSADYDPLDEDKLNNQISLTKSQINRLQFLAREYQLAGQVLMSGISPIPSQLQLAQRCLSTATKLTNAATNLEEELQKFQKNLKLLYEFDCATRKLFTSGTQQLEILSQSMQVLNQTIVHRDGSYTFPIGIDKSWLRQQKSIPEKTYQVVQYIFNLEDDVLDRMDLSPSQCDWIERSKILFDKGALHIYQNSYDSKLLWEIASDISAKNPQFADKFLDGMIQIEKLANNKMIRYTSRYVEKGYQLYDKVASPVKSVLKSCKLEKTLASSKLFTRLGSKAKALSKENPATTLAGVALEGIAGGITDGVKEKSIGKGLIGGTLDMIKSVGPLEGATIGSMIYPGIGTAVGVLAGVIILSVNFVNPRVFPAIKQSAFAAYDHVMHSTQKVRQKLGKSIVRGWETIKSTFAHKERYVALGGYV